MGFPPHPGFLPLHLQLCRYLMVRFLPVCVFTNLIPRLSPLRRGEPGNEAMSSHRFTYHDTGVAYVEWLTHFGYCSQRECGHLPTARLRRRAVAGLMGFPPHSGFWPLATSSIMSSGSTWRVILFSVTISSRRPAYYTGFSQ